MARVDYAAFPAVKAPSPSTARTWYVATTGDDLATGAPDRTLRTVEAALRQAGNGDIVYVHGGTYASTGLVVTQSDFLLSAYPGETVTIEPTEASSTQGLTVAAPGQHDVTVRGLQLQGFADVGIYAGNPQTVHHLSFEDVVVSGSDVGFAGNFEPGAVAVDGLLVRRRMTLSDIRDAGFRFGEAAGRNVRITGLHVQMAPPIGVGPAVSGIPGSAGNGSAGLAFAAGDNVLVENTIVEGVAGDGIDLRATRVAVVNTVVRRAGGSGIRLGAGGDVINCIVFNTGADAQLVTGGGSYRIIDCTFANTDSQAGNPVAAAFGYPNSVGDVALINSAFFEQSGPLYFSGAMNVHMQYCDFWGFPGPLVEWGERSWTRPRSGGRLGRSLGPAIGRRTPGSSIRRTAISTLDLEAPCSGRARAPCLLRRSIWFWRRGTPPTTR